MKRKRRVFFYLLVAFFLLCAPIVIAYALGIRFNFVRGEVEQTGGIFVKSSNSRLSVFLNGNFMKETSLLSGGTLLTEVAPGVHLLRIEKIGYKPWSKTVAVEPSLVTELRNILLVPGDLAPQNALTRETALLKTAIREYPFRIDKKNNLVQKTATSSRIIATNIHSFFPQENTVLFIDTNGFLAELKREDYSIAIIGRPGFFLDNKKVGFFASLSGDVVMLDSAGGVYLYEPGKTVTPIGKDVKNVRFDENGIKALLMKEASIGLLWLADNQYQPFQKRGTVENILNAPSRILDAIWFYADNAHVIINTAEGIFFVEIDGRGGRNTSELYGKRADEIGTTLQIPDTVFWRQGKVWKKVSL